MFKDIPVYDITLHPDLLVDPTFAKSRKFTEFFPVKFRTIDSRKFEDLSASSRSLLIHIIGVSHTQGSPKITLSETDVPRFRGASVKSLISELCDSGYLECPYIKEIIEKKEIKDISTEPQKAVAVVPPKINQTPINLLNKEVLIRSDLIASWADTYPAEYLQLELKKARNWLLSNSHKAPKSNFGRFLNSWFDRGWEQYRKNLPSNGTQLTADSLEEMLRGES